MANRGTPEQGIKFLQTGLESSSRLSNIPEGRNLVADVILGSVKVHYPEPR